MIDLIEEAGYEQTMKNTVLPWLEKRKTSGTFSREEGKPLYYEHFASEELNAVPLVLVHGFSSPLPKWYESIYYLTRSGFSVWILQQREHGKSFRSTKDLSLIHIEDYNDLVEDLHYFVTQVVRKSGMAPGRRLVLFAHSMGGGVGALCLERYPDDFAKAVLTAPMLEMTTGSTPMWAVKLLTRMKILFGKGKQYMPGSVPFRPVPDFEHALSDSEARYLYVFNLIRENPLYQMCIPSFQTAYQFLLLTREAVKPENCAKVTADTLLLQAEKDTMVGLEGQREFIRRIAKGRLEVFPEAKHELYLQGNEGLKKYWEMILSFLKNHDNTAPNEG